MFLDDKIYQAYLEEMESLEDFRTSNTTLQKDTPLELLEDPDTLRLVESLAFFSARSRMQGLKRIAQIHQVLFRQYFSFLINPIPSMGLVQASPTLKIPEQTLIPEEAELICTTYDERKAAFQTLNPLIIAPLYLEDFNFYKRIQGGWHLEFTFDSPHLQSEDLKQFTLYINHLNSFLGSIKTYFALCRATERVQIFYQSSETNEKKGLPCRVEFGWHEHRKVFNHPLERLRSQLHFPEQEMFLTVELPKATKKWDRFTLQFDLNENWPKDLNLTKSSFAPFVVPIVNLKTGTADPIECNGTKDDYPILYPNPKDHFSLHTVLSVLEILPEGMTPLKPGILDTQGNTYEIDFFEQTISLDLPNSFEKPKKVVVEALWTQLWFNDYIDQEHSFRFLDQHTSSFSLHLLQQMRGHEIPLTANDPKFLLRILSLKNQNHLTLNELLFLINSLKKIDRSYFKFIPNLIKELKVEQHLDRAGVGPTICYTFELKEWDGRNWELVAFFFKVVNDFLNCWLSNFHVETAVFFPNIKTPLIIKGGVDNELSVLARDFFLS